MSKIYYDAYAIRQNDNGPNEWIRVGAAFENKDGSINVVLHCNPIDGKLQLRKPQQKEKA
ncbi:MAG TPA: hypothetical protein ENI90_03295 [Methylothermaceae bacterium]|nr:hypothetical protein [Methylothermaceae bacterium]